MPRINPVNSRGAVLPPWFRRAPAKAAFLALQPRFAVDGRFVAGNHAGGLGMRRISSRLSTLVVTVIALVKSSVVLICAEGYRRRDSMCVRSHYRRRLGNNFCNDRST